MAAGVDIYDVSVLENAKSQAYSVGGGNHITINSDDTTLDDVTSGDLVVVDRLVGVALTDYNDYTGEVAIDISGVHNIEVVAQDDDGNEDIFIGTPLFYDINNACVDAEPSIYPVGRALEYLAGGQVAVIAVKLGWVGAST